MKNRKFDMELCYDEFGIMVKVVGWLMDDVGMVVINSCSLVVINRLVEKFEKLVH